MIGYTPAPLVNESFHSIVSRIQSCLALNGVQTLSLLFGGHQVYPTTGLANFLNNFCLATSTVLELTSEQLIEKHTIANYFSHFYSKKKWRRIVTSMLRGDNSLMRYMGIARSGMDQKLPRYCPSCNLESHAKNGIIYWNRYFQIPNISVCPIHECFLEVAKLEYVIRGSHRFTDAQPKNCPVVEPRPCTLRKLTVIAKKMILMLNSPGEQWYYQRDYRR